MKRELEYMDSKSSKFWHIELDGNKHTVTYGRTGSKGQSKTKEFDSDEKAKASFNKLIDQKLSKGYADAGGASPASTTKAKAPSKKAASAKPSSGTAGSGARREFQLVDGSSAKFWAIEFSGSSHTVNYGRIGTKGQSKTKDFDTPEKAKAAGEKLIDAKVSKGYSEVSGDSDAASEGGDDGRTISTLALRGLGTRDDLEENAKTFIGLRVADYNMEKGAKKGGKTVYRFRTDWDEELPVPEQLNHFLDSDAALEAVGLVIGIWSLEGDPNTEVVELLKARADRLPNLRAIYFGDITPEEYQMSWLQTGEVTFLLEAFPKLELLRARGSDVGVPNAKSEHLRGLILETGGMNAKIAQQVCKADFPNLEHLELWLGDEGYGATVSVEDLRPILSGERFPKLKYLGLRNAEISDGIAAAIVKMPLINQLEVLDLSLGTLSDVGAKALLEIPQDKNLKRVNIHHHFVSRELCKELKELDVPFDTSGAQEARGDGEDVWRFVAIGE